jgi:hypothetical protein
VLCLKVLIVPWSRIRSSWVGSGQPPQCFLPKLHARGFVGTNRQHPGRQQQSSEVQVYDQNAVFVQSGART